MKSHKRDKSVNLGERHRFDSVSHSGEVGERLIKASHVLGKRSLGVILDGHALLTAAHNKLMSDSIACTREQSEN
jgi:hypothetical protein